MWRSARQRSNVLYFDATGSIHKIIKRQKNPFFYSLVFHDSINSSIIPLAEFLTTANDQTNVTKILLSIKNLLTDCKKNLYPSVIVVDHSYCLINSVMSSFNGCHLSVYLNWCFDMIFKKPSNLEFINLIKVKVYLCSTHFLKNIIKQTKSINANENVKKGFIFMFTLLQNSVTYKQFDSYLMNIHNIFNNQYLDESVFLSLKFLLNELRVRNLSSTKADDVESPDQKIRNFEFDKFLKESNVYMKQDFDETLKNSSPWKLFLDQRITNFHKLLIEKYSMNRDQLLPNEFFCKPLFAILEKYFHLVPLWSGICVQEELLQTRIKSRFSNNFVESWFRQIKHCILKKRKVSTSELSSALYKRLLSKYHQFYSDKIVQNSIENAKIDQITEKWKDKNEKYKREKGFFYDNHSTIHGSLYNYEYDEMENEDFQIIFSKYSRSKESFIQNDLRENDSIFNVKCPIQNDDIQMETNAEEAIYLPEEIVEMDTNYVLENKNELKESSLRNLKTKNDQIFTEEIGKDLIQESYLDFGIEFEKFPKPQKIFDYDLFRKDYANIFSIFNKISRPVILYVDVKKYLYDNIDLIHRVINYLRLKLPNLIYTDQILEKCFVSKLALPENLLPLKIAGDGNCLYNSFAKIYFNDEKYYYIIKLCSIFILFEYEIFFKYLMIRFLYSYTFKKFILNTCKTRQWGNELNILSISILLNRTVISYSEAANAYSNINNRLIFNLKEYITEPILIGISNLHFFPIVINDQILLTKIYLNKDVKFLEGIKKEEIKMYD